VSRKVWAAPGQSYYVCMLEGRAGGSSASCGHLIATTTANTGVKRHLEGRHPELLVAKQPNPATEGKTSNFQAVLAVLESGLPYNQFTVKSGSLRKLLPAFPSANTFRKYAREMVPITVANIKEALGRVSSIGVTFDFTPLPNRELAAVNVHLWGRHGPEVLTLAVQEMEGSLTSDAISTWLKKVADLYGIKLLTTTPTDDPAVLLWAGTDSGSNVVGAGKALVDPYVTYQSSLLPDFFGWSFCVAHGGNLLIHDALSHGFIGPLIETIVGHTKAIRHSRTLREAVVEQGIPTPGRLVTTRWRSLMRLIRYWVQNAAKLEAASDQFAIAPNDLNKLALVFGILEPVDLFIARSQADVAGDAFFIPIRVFGILAVYKKKQGFRKLVVDSTTTTPMVAADFDTSLSSWLGFVTERFEERFLSTNTADFEVVDDGESDTDDDDECDDDDDVDEVDDGDNVEWRGPRARFKHQCLLMHSAVLAAFGLSPLGSAWGAGVAEGALTSEDARQLVDDANVDGVKQALLIRFMTDSDWRRAVRGGARAGGAGGATPAAGILGMLQGPPRGGQPHRLRRDVHQELRRIGRAQAAVRQLPSARRGQAHPRRREDLRGEVGGARPRERAVDRSRGALHPHRAAALDGARERLQHRPAHPRPAPPAHLARGACRVPTEQAGARVHHRAAPRRRHHQGGHQGYHPLHGAERCGAGAGHLIERRGGCGGVKLLVFVVGAADVSSAGGAAAPPCE